MNLSDSINRPGLAPAGTASFRAPKRVLIMTAVEAERDAVQRGLGGHAGAEVRLAGVGPAAAAAATAAALAAAG
ncbi:MAG: futalosine hydrolase, partial [Paenibacillus macerans]|nr:futalosine hydrolase [Paenibacillus macerans]